LRLEVDELCKWFIEPLRQSRQSMADHGYEILLGLLGHTWALGAKADVPESSPNAEWVKKCVVSLNNAEYAQAPRTSRYSEENAALKEILKTNPDIGADDAAQALRAKDAKLDPTPKTLTGERLIKAQQAFSTRLSRAKKNYSSRLL
jgi:hypothetical protein